MSGLFCSEDEPLTHSKITPVIDPQHHIVCVLNSNSNMLRWHDSDKTKCCQSYTAGGDERALKKELSSRIKRKPPIRLRCERLVYQLILSQPQPGSLQRPDTDTYSIWKQSGVWLGDGFQFPAAANSLV